MPHQDYLWVPNMCDWTTIIFIIIVSEGDTNEYHGV